MSEDRFAAIIAKLTGRTDLNEQEAGFAMEKIMEGKISNVKIAAFLTGLKTKGESPDEIAAFAKIIREKCIKINAGNKNLIDTAGTGGDLQGTFNISTGCALVSAGAGAAVAKHGNRSSSGKSGSADVLEELGVRINLTKEEAEKQLREIGITFLFAQNFHPAMKNAAAARKELGFRTVFNMLGPLTNPASAKRQLIGASDNETMAKLASALRILGTEKAIVVCSETDEVSISGETRLIEIENGELKEYGVCPEEFGFARADKKEMLAKNKKESAEIILNVLKGKKGPQRDIVLLNSGTAIYVSGLSGTINDGIKLAENAIDSGAALEKLELMRGF